MSAAHDINKVVSSLASSKTKDRSDALTLLENICNSKFRLNGRQFKSIVSAVFEMIAHETRIYNNNRTGLVEVRMSRAADSLRILTDKAIDDTKICLKYKSYLELLQSAMEHFFDSSQSFTPCSMDFMILIGRIVSQGFVKDHLNKKEWARLNNFLKKVIRQVLSLNESTIETNGNEKLLIESFTALHNLLQCNTAIGINYLQVLDNYFDLLSIISMTVKVYKKENVLIIIIFKIINKLMMVLSTQDLKFVKKLAEIGLRLFLSCSQTSWDSLHVQFLIFLNLSSTHNSFNLDDLPKLIGDTSDILTEWSDYNEEAETSIRSPLNSPLQVRENIKVTEGDEYLLYSMKMLIQSLIGRMNSSTFKFEANDISLVHTTNHKKTWFKLKSLYLSSESFKPWLLSSGISKLIVTFFHLKEIIGKRTALRDSNQMASEIFGTGGSILPSSKRQKLGVVSEALRQSHNILQFCNYLINCKTQPEMQEAGLQLLVFHLETYKRTAVIANKSVTSRKVTSRLEDSDESYLDSDASFDILASNSGEFFDKNIVFKNVLRTFDNDDLAYWSLLAISTLTNDYILSDGETLKPKYFFQVLKIALQLLKRKELSCIACNLVFSIILCSSNEDLARLIDKSIMNQLDNLIDLSEINGPFSITNESFQLWYAIHKVIRDINSQKKFTLADKIQDWIAAKWSISFNLDTKNLLYTNSGLPEFLCWLCGISVKFIASPHSPGLYNGPLNEVFLFQDSYQSLENFIMLEEVASVSAKEKSIAIEQPGQLKRIEELLILCSSSIQLCNNEDSNPLLTLEWAFTINRISHYLRSSTQLAHILSSFSYQFNSTLQAFKDSSFSLPQILSFVALLTTLDVSEIDTQMILLNFPFEKFISTLSRAFQVGTDNRSIANDMDLEFGNSKQSAIDLEFGSIRQNESKREKASDILTHFQLQFLDSTCVSSIKLLFLNYKLHGRDTNLQVSAAVAQMEMMVPTDILYSVHYIISLFETNKLNYETLSSDSASKLIRIVGEKLLNSHEIERNELTLITISKLMSLMTPLFTSYTDEDFKKDCYDICQWLIECGERNLILTEASSTEFCIFLVNFVRLNDQVVYDSAKLKAILLQYFEMMPNICKVNLTHVLVPYLAALGTSEQAAWYNGLFQNFKSPEMSVETSATYTMFFSSLSRSSPQIMLSSLFNLLELTRFPFFIPYLEVALDSFCEFTSISGPRDLFKSLKFEILNCWMKFDTISKFPFALFQYSEMNKFILENYKELVGIIIAGKQVNSNYDNALLNKISQIKSTSLDSLVSESLPLIVSLAFTRDGTRNAVFETLAGYLKDNFKTDFRQKLPIIVLEIIKHTDLANESQLSDIFGGATKLISKSKVLERPGETKISLTTSLELIRKLVGKYSKDVQFWSTPQVYFQLRRLSLLFKLSISTDQRILLLRKLKLVIFLGPSTLDFEVCRLLIQIVCPLLPQEDLRTDLFALLGIIDIQNFSRFSEASKIPLVIELLTSLLEIKSSITHSLVLLEIQGYVNRLDHSRGVYPVFLAAVNVLLEKPVTIESSIVDLVLDDENEMRICVNESGALRLISSIFPFLVKTQPTVYKAQVVKILLKAQSEVIAKQSIEFNSWTARYLANYYLKGDFTAESSELLELNEYHDTNGDEFESQIKHMDITLSQIVSHLSDVDWEISACAESILGALTYKFLRSKEDVLAFLNFDCAKYSTYTLPLDFQSCILLNDDSEIEFLGDKIDDIVRNLDALGAKESFTLWSTKFLLALLQELALHTSIAPLFACFAIKVPTFAAEALPFFVCYYISVKGNEGLSLISSLYHEFSVLKICDIKAIGLFIRTLLLIRIGAKKGLSNFDKVFQAVDLKIFCALASNVKLFKTAFLLFEDWKSTSIDKSITAEDAKMLTSIYESIDDDDLIYGLPAEASVEYALNSISRDHEWSADQLQFSSAKFDSQISLNADSRNSTILESMLQSGLMGVSSLISKNVGLKSDENYEWAWKLNRWELPIPQNAIGEHEVIYKTLKQIYEYPTNACSICEENTLDILLKKDLIVSSVSSKELRKKTSNWIKTIAVVSSIENILVSTNLFKTIEVFEEKTSWFETSDIASAESILLARQVTLQTMSQFPGIHIKFENDDIWLSVVSNLVRFSNLARSSKESQKMVSSTMLIEEISKSKFSREVSKEIGNFSRYQVASTLWAQGQTSIPVAMLKDVEKDGSIELPLDNLSIDRSLMNANLVGWMADSRQELAAKLMEDYVLPTALTVSSSVKHLDQQSEVYRLLGHFCEEQYKSRNLTEEIGKLGKRVIEKQQEIDELKAHYGKTTVPAQEKKAVQRFYGKLKNQLAAELTNLTVMKSNKERFSNKAVEFYLKSIIIASSDDNDETSDKFFALWLEHSSNDELNMHLRLEIASLPSHKFVSWCTQLISRLSNEKSEFQTILQSLIVNLCVDHPYQTLYQLISLRKYESLANETSNPIMVAKYTTANKIWQQLLTQDKKFVDEVLLPIESFCEEAIKLAMIKPTRGKALSLEKLSVGRLWNKEMPNIPPPTKYLPIDNTTRYKNVPRLHSVERKITVATSGLSLPKIGKFMLTNGEEHKMLFKSGTDDLRQDSIMEQVFEKVNYIFAKDRETRKRRLNIRTYKAIPLGPNCGIIEFVPNSIALIDVVKPYHLKYDKIKLEKAREMMKLSQSGDKSERFKAFEQVIAKMSPVLHYFFAENFLTPDVWFNSRIAYTHGIATNSMVGHMLGLGDRHCNNILLDKNSGEPVHIDLGVAFDQGRRLPIPETVPFRLTRDLVDGFGSSGVEGVFKKSCEHTFRVLRSNKEHILSILDVLRWDPLYSWSISPIRKKKLQEEVAAGVVGHLKPQEDGSEAGRAVSSVSDKLVAGGLSNEAAVRELINEATSTENLALIYYGWSPFF